MSEVKEDDLALFDSVAYVNAAENYLPFGKLHVYVCVSNYNNLNDLAWPSLE